MSALGQPIHDVLAAVLEDGTEITARSAARRDLDQLHALAAHQGIMCDDLELARLLRSDPAERAVLCVTAPAAGGAGGESVIGVGVIELHSISTLPTLVMVDPAYGPPLARWLVDVLVERARSAA